MTDFMLVSLVLITTVICECLHSYRATMMTLDKEHDPVEHII